MSPQVGGQFPPQRTGRGELTVSIRRQYGCSMAGLTALHCKPLQPAPETGTPKQCNMQPTAISLQCQTPAAISHIKGLNGPSAIISIITPCANREIGYILSNAIVYYNVAFLQLLKRQGHFPAGRLSAYSDGWKM